MIYSRITRKLLQDAGVDAWVSYDFQGSNPVFWHLFGTRRHATRRVFLIMRGNGDTTLVAHALDEDQFRAPGVTVRSYVTWRELHATLSDLLGEDRTIAMEYSPHGELPSASFVDAGTVELIGGLGPEVVTSGGLFQAVAASWDQTARASQQEALQHIVAVRDETLSLLQDELPNAQLTESDVQSFVLDELTRRGLEVEGRPIVALGPNSSKPHYEPTVENSAPIVPNAVLMLDLWGRVPGEHHVFGDITWMAYTGSEVPPEVSDVFDAVKAARDAVLAELRDAWSGRRAIAGWQLDQIARERITAAGYAQGVRHRTGHSLGPGPRLHALGVNLDDYETHDTRTISANTGFTVEPGVYLDRFGVRLEVDVFVDARDGPIVVSPLQEHMHTLG